MSVAVFKGTTSPWTWSHIWLVVRVVGVNPSLICCRHRSSHRKQYSSNCSRWNALAICIPSDAGIGEGKIILAGTSVFGFGRFATRLRRRTERHDSEGFIDFGERGGRDSGARDSWCGMASWGVAIGHREYMRSKVGRG